MLRWPLQLDFATAQFLLVFWLLTFCILALSRAIGQWMMDFLRSRGRNLRNVIIVGEALDAIALADRIRREASLGYRVLRIIDSKEMKDNGRIAGDI